ncbi:MAG TPA: DivIVA domain-containing protein [Acidimicrobiia bacterium]|nr:DivIVA domain-containing protein [Acidimicrobiia bacterium]
MADDDSASNESDAPEMRHPAPDPTDSLSVAIQALRGAQFEAKFRGYSRSAVDSFVERIATALEAARKQAQRDQEGVSEIVDFARHAMEAEVQRGKEEAERVIAEAEQRRQEAEAGREALATERERLTADTERAQEELRAELERTRLATVATEQGRDDVEAERTRLEDTRQAMESERQELSALREEARAAESRAHDLRRKLLAETEKAISQRWAELGDHLTNVTKQQATRLMELVSDYITQLDPTLLSGAIPPPVISRPSEPPHLSAIPYRDPETGQ